jgi:hypothetical protein
MENSNPKDLTYTQVANALRPDAKGPINKTLVENRLNMIQPQKYQYYDGPSNVIGTPYYTNGEKNTNFTSPSFLSNAIFYEPSSNLGLKRQDMYRTTTNLLHSNSFDKLKIVRDKGRDRINVRK